MTSYLPRPGAMSWPGDPSRSIPSRRKVLIVNPGYRETLAPDPGDAVSLGDILRSTVILHLFPSDLYHVTWLVDPAGYPLLRGNPKIDRILRVNTFTAHQLTSEWFDVVVNLESDPGVCALVNQVPAWRRYGFCFDPLTGEAHAYENAEEALSMSRDVDYKRKQGKSWSEILYGILGSEYRGEGYVLGYEPKTREVYDVGLNHKVGSKFPLKRWPEERWKALSSTLEASCSVSWQQSANDIEGYIDWINSCRVLVTNDSLGLHVALALGKKVVALFGPTIPSEFDDHQDLVKLAPKLDWDCIPCLESTCDKTPHCMAHIPIETVAREALDLVLRARNEASESDAPVIRAVPPRQPLSDAV